MKKSKYLIYVLIIVFAYIGFSKFALLKFYFLGTSNELNQHSVELGHISYDEIETLFLLSDNKDTISNCLGIIASKEFTKNKFKKIINKINSLYNNESAIPEDEAYDLYITLAPIFSLDNGLKNHFTNLPEFLLNFESTQQFSPNLLDDLTESKHTNHTNLIKKMLTHPNPRVRESSVWIVGNLPIMWQYLFNKEIKLLLKDPDEGVQYRIQKIKKNIQLSLDVWK